LSGHYNIRKTFEIYRLLFFWSLFM